MFIDTHCHITDEKFTDTDGVVRDYLAAGVYKVIDMGCDVLSSIKGKTASEKHDSVYFAAGIHPEEAGNVYGGDLDVIESLANHKKCVAIGEIGLDYYWDDGKKKEQQQLFVDQILLADKLSLPISVHSRSATKDTLDLLKEYKGKLQNGFVMHCYSGSLESAKEYIKLGGYIAFGGTVTFKNSKNLVEVVKGIQKDRILLETDCPYLAPEPLRGSINSPKNIPLIANKLREILNENQDFYYKTTENAKRLFFKLNNV